MRPDDEPGSGEHDGNGLRSPILERFLRWIVDDPEASQGLIGDLVEELERGTSSRRAGWLVYRLRMLRITLAYGLGAAESKREPSSRSGGRRPVASVWERTGRAFVHALRGLPRDRSVLAAALLTLTLGVSAATAVYAIVAGVLIRDLPYLEPERLVFLRADYGNDQGVGVVEPETFLDIRSGSSLTTWAGVGPESVVPIKVGDRRYGLSAAYVTPDLFPLLGIDPVLGRHLSKEDTDLPPAGSAPILLSHDAWKRILGADPEAVGRTISTNGLRRVVVGVLPEQAEIWLGHGTSVSPDVDIWWPYRPERGPGGRQSQVVRAIGRLTAGATLATAQAELEQVARSMREAYPDVYAQREYSAVPLREDLVRPVRSALLLLGALVTTVLLIAVANATGLLLARGRARELPLATKRALGATRRQLLAELAAEAVVAAGLVGLTGILGARGLFQLLASTAPSSLPRIHEATFDPSVVAAGVGLAVLTTLLASAFPAVKSLGVSPRRILQATASRSGSARLRVGTRGALIVFQVALSVILVLGACLLARSFVRLTRVDLGFDPASLVVLHIQDHEFDFTSTESWSVRSDAIVSRARRTHEALREIESVVSSSQAFQAPLGSWPVDWRNYGRTAAELLDARRRAVNVSVTPGYFETLEIPLLVGREFDWNDVGVSTPDIAIVTQDVAGALWPAGDAVGRTLHIDAAGSDPVQVEIVGVAGANRVTGLRGEPTPQVYLPGAWTDQALIVRTKGDPDRVGLTVRRQLDERTPWLSVSAIETMDERVATAAAETRFTATVVSALAVAGLLLTCAGLFALAAYLARSRRREHAIRVALGARASDIVRHGLTEVGRFVLVGVVVGLLGGLWMARILESVLHEVSAADPAVFLVAPALIVATGLAVAAVPAWRAAREDAQSILRAE